MPNFFQNLKNYFFSALSGFKELKNIRLSYLRKVFSLMGKKEKNTLIVLFTIAALSFFISLRNFYLNNTLEKPAQGGNYTEGLIAQPLYINPILAHNDSELSLTRLVFSSLYKFNDQGQIIPDLAENLPFISEDQKEYTVTIKQNVKWHNGRTLTAEDVIFTIETIKNPEYKSPLRSLWQFTTVEKISDFSVKFKTKDITGTFIQNLTLPIVSKYLWNKTDPAKFLLSQQNIKAIGTGPYFIKEIKLSDGKIQKLTLNNFTDYYDENSKIETLNFIFYESEKDALNALRSGEISGLGINSASKETDLPNDKNLLIHRIPFKQYLTIFLNLQSKIVSDPLVRQALNISLNKKEISEVVFGQNATPPSTFFSFENKNDAKFENQDLEKAKQLLDQAGWKIDPNTNVRSKKNIPLEINLSVNDTQTNSKTAEEVSKQWKDLGIKVNLNTYNTKDLEEKSIKNRNFDALIIPLKTGYDPDPFFFWHSSQAKSPGLNLSSLQNPTIDKLISEARAQTNQNLRAQKYLEIEKNFNQELPAIFLSQSSYLYILDNKIKNFGATIFYEPYMRVLGIPSWYTKTSRAWK